MAKTRCCLTRRQRLVGAGSKRSPSIDQGRWDSDCAAVLFLDFLREAREGKGHKLMFRARPSSHLIGSRTERIGDRETRTLWKAVTFRWFRTSEKGRSTTNLSSNHPVDARERSRVPFLNRTHNQQFRALLHFHLLYALVTFGFGGRALQARSLAIAGTAQAPGSIYPWILLPHASAPLVAPVRNQGMIRGSMTSQHQALVRRILTGPRERNKNLVVRSYVHCPQSSEFRYCARARLFACRGRHELSWSSSISRLVVSDVNNGDISFPT